MVAQLIIVRGTRFFRTQLDSLSGLCFDCNNSAKRKISSIPLLPRISICDPAKAHGFESLAARPVATRLSPLLKQSRQNAVELIGEALHVFGCQGFGALGLHASGAELLH